MADMPKSEAKDTVLEFLAEYDLALPPAAIYRNLRLKYRFPFTDETLLTYLGELVEDGLIERIDPDELENREVVPVDDTNRRCYYIISKEGVRYLSE
jgi:hypothetical protein